MPRVISIVNQKGGVGKTTTTVNLGAALAMSGKRVLLVDLDPQSNTTRALGFMADPGRPSVYDALGAAGSLADTFLATEIDGLTLAPAEPDLVGFEIEALERESREYCLRRLVVDLDGPFDFVLIDCPPSLGVLTVNGLAAADAVLIPVQCEYLALEGVTLLMATLERMRESVNPALELGGILLTMFDERTNLSRQVVEDIRSFFGEKAFATVIPRSVRLSEAPSFGKPISLYDPKSKGAEAYLSLAREVMEREIAAIPDFPAASVVEATVEAQLETREPDAVSEPAARAPEPTLHGRGPDAPPAESPGAAGESAAPESTTPDRATDEILIAALEMSPGSEVTAPSIDTPPRFVEKPPPGYEIP